jgi:hypothetical protein
MTELGGVAWEYPPRPTTMPGSGSGAGSGLGGRGGGRGRGRDFYIVAGEERLSGEVLDPDWWVLVTVAGRPAAFLTPAAAAAATAAETVIDYLRQRGTAYVADLTDYQSVFDRYFRDNDTQRSAVVFHTAAPALLGVTLSRAFVLTENYCEHGYEPIPPNVCPECNCYLETIEA